MLPEAGDLGKEPVDERIELNLENLEALKKSIERDDDFSSSRQDWNPEVNYLSQ